MRLIVRFKKGDAVRFVSHLDTLRLFQRAFRRAGLPLAFSQGFNPHPLMSFATALSVGFTGEGEYMDVILTNDVSPEEFKASVNAALPEGVEIVEVIDAGASKASLTSAMNGAAYDIALRFDGELEEGELENAVDALLSGEIVVIKKTKGGPKPTDIRPMIRELKVVSAKGNEALLFMRGALSAEGGLNPELLLAELYRRLGCAAVSAVNRKEIELDMKELLK